MEAHSITTQAQCIIDSLPNAEFPAVERSSHQLEAIRQILGTIEDPHRSTHSCFVWASRDSAADVIGALRNDGTMRLRQSRGHQRAPRPSYALQARRSGAPRAHPTARIACLTGILSRLMPGVVVGVEPHPRVAFVGVEPHPWIAIVNVEPHPWVAFVDVEPRPHVVFVVPGAHPHAAFVVPGAHPHVAFVELRLRPRLLCVGTTRVLREHGTLALSSGEPAFLLPLLPPRSTSSLTRRCRDFAKK
ncbi:hypothetical protein B0H13DRAFT_2336854 [Mycena leptocephala]|nr:hypothetical protein B0H13DRAFT_2336854 [Mycena leptocephala]